MFTELAFKILGVRFGATDVARQGTKFFEYQRDIGLRSRSGVLLSGFGHVMGRVKDKRLRTQPKTHAVPGPIGRTQ
jgi:hypothetical protein